MNQKHKIMTTLATLWEVHSDMTFGELLRHINGWPEIDRCDEPGVLYISDDILESIISEHNDSHPHPHAKPEEE